MREFWKDIKECDYIQVSNKGRVRSKDRIIYNEGSKRHNTIKGKIFKNRLTKNGYFQVALRINKTYIYRYVHRLVAEAFLGCIKDKEINHIDCDKTNNNIKNLEIVCFAENVTHAKNNRLYKHGENHGLSTISNDTIVLIRKLKKEGMKNVDIASQFNIPYKKIWAINKYKIYKHIK